MTQAQALAILKSGSNVFLTGEPGAGKSYTINQFVEWLKERNKPYAITASTGIAATHINGTTVHSWAGIGIKRKITENQVHYMMENMFTCQRICRPGVLIIDEVSMLEAQTINDIDYVLRVIRGITKPFGGMQVVFVGDFFQLPPVSKEEEVKFAFEAWAWQEAKPKVCYLTEQHRQSDQDFLDILSAIRNGTVKPEHRARLDACSTNPIPDTQLYTHNKEVDEENTAELAKLPGEEKIFEATTSGIPFMIDILKKSCLSPEFLKLKVGAVVMFTKNNFEAGYVNGTIGKVLKFNEEGFPVILFYDNSEELVKMSISEKDWNIEENGKIKATFTQIPLRLAWAITVHKSQGMSLDAASIDLAKCFEYGQGYVAISRVRSLAGLHLQGINDKAFMVHPKILEQDIIFRKEGENV